MAFKTEAIVLHSRVLKGADRVYELLSPSEGRLSVVARSAAKSTSKMAGHLQPFAHVRVMVGRGKMDHLAGADTITSYRILRESWFDFILASSLVELLLRTNAAGQTAAEEFEMLRTAFGLFEKYEDRSKEKVLVARIFLWKLLSLSGWRPNLEQCALCRAPLTQGEIYYLSPRGFVCFRHGREGVALDPELVVLLERVISETDWEQLVASTLGIDLQKQWLEVSQLFYQDIISNPLQSLKLFNYV